MTVKDPIEDSYDKDRVVAYLASLINIINYIDDTGQEYHHFRVVIAKEWHTIMERFVGRLEQEHEDETTTSDLASDQSSRS